MNHRQTLLKLQLQINERPPQRITMKSTVSKISITTIDQYIATFPADVRKILQALRKTIKASAPKAEECISYKMPAFRQGGNLVYFAGYKKHVGFYPMPGPIRAFKKELAVYKSAKGSVQFPLDRPLPLDLIRKMVKFRVAEVTGKRKNPESNCG